MGENDAGFIAEAVEMVKTMLDADVEEQEFLDRLWSFGEGYFDFTTFEEAFGQSGETGLDKR